MTRLVFAQRKIKFFLYPNDFVSKGITFVEILSSVFRYCFRMIIIIIMNFGS